jgi:hypothetical protein
MACRRKYTQALLILVLLAGAQSLTVAARAGALTGSQSACSDGDATAPAVTLPDADVPDGFYRLASGSPLLLTTWPQEPCSSAISMWAMSDAATAGQPRFLRVEVYQLGSARAARTGLTAISSAITRSGGMITGGSMDSDLTFMLPGGAYAENVVSQPYAGVAYTAGDLVVVLSITTQDEGFAAANTYLSAVQQDIEQLLGGRSQQTVQAN